MYIDTTKRINLVSLKNIDVANLWAKKSLKIPIIPYKGIRFMALFVIFDFWTLKRGVAPQNPTKKLTHLVDLLGHLLSRNRVSNFSDLTKQIPSPRLEGNDVHIGSNY